MWLSEGLCVNYKLLHLLIISLPVIGPLELINTIENPHAEHFYIER